MMKIIPTVSVIGPGALGGALIDFLQNHTDSFDLYSVWGRTKNDSFIQKGPAHLNAESSFPEHTNELGKICLITVPDDQIVSVAERLSKLSPDLNAFSFIHFSGNHSSDLLTTLSNKGAAVASMHPLQTFTKGDQANRFKEIWFTIEGSGVLLQKLELLASEADAHTIRMNSEQKKAMHLAAVFASNYMVSLMSAVEKITLDNDIDQGVEILKPLIYQSLNNIFQKGIDRSLSGPILRGDKSTINAHLKLIGQKSNLQLLYKQLGIQALEIADRSGRLSKKDSESIRKILSENVS